MTEPIAHMYNPCVICGNTEFLLKEVMGNKDLPDGTPCIVCRGCGRYGSAMNWNRVNPSGAPDATPDQAV